MFIVYSVAIYLWNTIKFKKKDFIKSEKRKEQHYLYN